MVLEPMAPNDLIIKISEKNEVESYEKIGNSIVRKIFKRNNTHACTEQILNQEVDTEGYSLAEVYDMLWLRNSSQIVLRNPLQKLYLADLFCGLGGMSLGIVEAGAALGIEIIPKLAVDNNIDAINTYKLNFPSANCYDCDINNLLDGGVGNDMTENEKKLKSKIGRIDFVVAGPPCQGNSDLNNHTRRNDPKNSLFLKVARFIEIFSPDYVIIENVQGVKHDKGQITALTKNNLLQLGYNVEDGLLMASSLGVAQKRRRYFLIATKSRKFQFSSVKANYIKPERSFLWACSDLMSIKISDVFNTAAKHSEINQKRIDYLFNCNLFELPNDQRPDCHKKGGHSYKSVYGRMYIDRPSPTITSGFGSIGQGRFGHPTQRRSITPHEAARLQFIPDFFKFLPTTKRGGFQKMIGNAVPSKLSFLITLELLR